jgi:hypothetical protein
VSPDVVVVAGRVSGGGGVVVGACANAGAPTAPDIASPKAAIHLLCI